MITVIPLRCPTCEACQNVERDECGAELELWPCQGSDTCAAKLCRNCRVQCFSCGLHACDEHVVLMAAEPWCHRCAAVFADELADERVPESAEVCQ